MPDLTGYTYQEALNELTALGINTNRIKTYYTNGSSGEKKSMIVSEQTPYAYSSISLSDSSEISLGLYAATETSNSSTPSSSSEVSSSSSSSTYDSGISSETTPSSSSSSTNAGLDPNHNP